MDTIPGMYSIGQYVYTAREIKGWFDYSVKNNIPVNSAGRIAGYTRVGKTTDSVVYEVIFNQEFGYVNIKHNDLKLG